MIESILFSLSSLLDGDEVIMRMKDFLFYSEMRFIITTVPYVLVYFVLSKIMTSGRRLIVFHVLTNILLVFSVFLIEEKFFKLEIMITTSFVSSVITGIASLILLSRFLGTNKFNLNNW